MIEKNLDPILIAVTGRATLLELKIKLLLSKNKYEIRGKSFSKVKNIMYDKFSEYLTKDDKQIIEKAVWIRNRLVHFELHAILENQQSISSVVSMKTVDPKDNSILKIMEKMSEEKSNPINKDSPLYGSVFRILFKSHENPKIKRNFR